QPLRSRYEFVQNVAQTIRENYKRLSATSQIFAEQMEEKLNGLLGGYVRLLYSSKVHADYVQILRPEQVHQEITNLEKSMANEPAKVQEINKRRIEILQKRLVKFDKIKENRRVIDAQCSAIEDVLQLIRDQSVTMRDPQEVSDQLDNLVEDVEQTEQSVKEMEQIFSLSTPESTEEFLIPPLPEPAQQAQPQSRTRIRN